MSLKVGLVFYLHSLLPFTLYEPQNKLYKVRWCTGILVIIIIIIITDLYSAFRCRSRSSKFVPVGTPICHFLLVFHCTYVATGIFCRFRVITIYWWKICFFVVFTSLIVVWSCRKGLSPVTNYTKFGLKKLDCLDYLTAKRARDRLVYGHEFWAVGPIRRVTDRRMNRRTRHIAKSRSAIDECGNKLYRQFTIEDCLRSF